MRRLVLLLALVLPHFAHASATVTVINNDGAGEGFNDPTVVATIGGNPGTTLGEQRLIAFQFAADLWGELITSAIEIRVAAEFNPLFCDPNAGIAVLGQAGTGTVHADFSGALEASTWYPQALANKLRGADLSPGTSDIGAEFNSAIGTTCAIPTDFYYGLDASPPGSDNDFVTIVLHEIGHGLGFSTFVNEATGARFMGMDDVFMLNLEDHSTGMLWPHMTNGERATSAIDTGDLHWVGVEVVAASGSLIDGVHASGHVEMFAPNPLDPGSSVSHWSDDLDPDELMEPVETGPSHDVGLALEAFVDIGWSVSVSGPLSKDDQKCVNEVNKNVEKVGKALGGDISKCTKDAGKGKLTTTYTECLTADGKGKVGKATGKLTSKVGQKCPSDPAFPAIDTSDTAGMNASALAKELAMINSLMGSSLDGAIVDCEDNKDNCKCQAAIVKQMYKCQSAKLKSFNACKKDGLKGKTTLIISAAQLESQCMDDAGMIPDAKGKIDKHCGTKLDSTISKKCPDTDIFPGCGALDVAGLADCVDQIVECEVCRLLNAIDGLSRDCDEFDDGVVNASCP